MTKHHRLGDLQRTAIFSVGSGVWGFVAKALADVFGEALLSGS